MNIYKKYLFLVLVVCAIISNNLCNEEPNQNKQIKTIEIKFKNKFVIVNEDASISDKEFTFHPEKWAFNVKNGDTKCQIFLEYKNETNPLLVYKNEKNQNNKEIEKGDLLYDLRTKKKIQTLVFETNNESEELSDKCHKLIIFEGKGFEDLEGLETLIKELFGEEKKLENLDSVEMEMIEYPFEELTMREFMEDMNDVRENLIKEVQNEFDARGTCIPKKFKEHFLDLESNEWKKQIVESLWNLSLEFKNFCFQNNFVRSRSYPYT
jgi:hypothetical protein